MHHTRPSSLFAVFLIGAAGLWAQGGPKSSIVPETFLRGYDPVTVFYDQSVGLARGGPADGPGPYLAIVPAVAGEYKWLDAKTIQFLPAVPWPALRQLTIRAKDRSLTLTTMMMPPSSISPASGSTGLEPISSFTLNFPAVLDADTLSRMIRIEVRELPGLSTEGSWWITSADFTVRELERTKTAANSSFLVTLKSPIPYGKYAILYLKLSLDESIRDSVARYTFQTKTEFRLVGMGAGSVRFPVTPSGAAYAVDQAVNCGTGQAPLFLEFSEEIRPVSVEVLKRLVAFEPAVRNLTAEVSGQRLYLRFEADRDKAYRITVTRQQAVQSLSGRALSPFAVSSFHFYYTQAQPYITWKAAQGIVERFGPQFIPMEGRGTGRVDLRVYKIDPENLNYWPFPSQPIVIDENSRPPMPGEEPVYGQDITRQIRLLPSPDISKIVDLPIGEQSARSSFGLTIGAELAAKFGSQLPGTYLIGYRALDRTSTRSYVRLTVTDLCLSTVEEESEIVFVVTSLKKGAPVPGAVVRVESRTDKGMQVMFSGTTNQTGQYRYVHTKAFANRPARIVVTKDIDILVLDPRSPPPEFADNHWYQSGSSWLDWITSDPQSRRHERRTNAYILTERPVYRPEEAVHIIGWVRDRQDGQILKYGGSEAFEVYVVGPGNKEWTFPAELGASGRFYVKFTAKDLPTGEYRAALRYAKGGRVLSSASFRMESYRVPLFEVNITGPDKVPLDAPFELTLIADYYAGGRVVGEEVDWDVTRYPYSISSPVYSGFLFSTDERFSSSGALGVSGALSKSDILDEQGSSKITLNPGAEKDGRACLYVARGTVVGADRQTVTSTKQVVALPPFSIGLKVDRFLATAEIKPQVVVLDHTEKPLAGTPFTVRLSQRQWHSYIAETDFTTGEAKYVTDTVDKVIAEQNLTSTAAVMSPGFTVKEAGVYIVSVFGRDFLGRQIMVSTDLFVSGPTPMAWEKTRANVFDITPDLKSYKPGQTAKLLLKSPYQDGMALVVVEHPQGNKYEWVKISNGQGVYSLTITAAMAPGVPVGVLLERGRVPGTEAAEGSLDLGRPSTMGASIRLAVDPVANQVIMGLEHEATVLPASPLKIRITLKDWTGKPLDGEASLWLVDKAVLSLGTEAKLDPLSAFIQILPSYLRLRDTRNLVFGNLPTEEIPGGDMGMKAMAEMAAELFERTTVRRNFQTVPYFNPSIPVKGGAAEIEVPMPDNLTDFAIRAVGTSGFDKLGSARSQVSVRLPVIVQPVLPRFVRPMDSFSAGGIGRVVEGPGGPALAGIKVEGLKLAGADPAQANKAFTLDTAKAERLLFPMSVPDTLMEAENAVVAVSLFVQRNADKMRDAFRIELPVRNDVYTSHLTSTQTVSAVGNVSMPEPAEPARKTSVSRTIIAARDPRLLSVVQGLNYLTGYVHGCLEQRVSRLLPAILLQDLLESTGIPKYYALNEELLQETFSYMASCQDESGLFGYWPGSTGYVTLTAYTVEFLVSCRNAKIDFDAKMLDRAMAALRQALRSDYSRFVSGWSSYERVEALAALDAAGIFDESYANDLARVSNTFGLYSQARLFTVMQSHGLGGSQAAKAIGDRLQAGVITKMEAGREIFAGFQSREYGYWGGLALGSEIKTIGSMMDAIFRIDPKSAKLGFLTDYLISRSGDSGWGSTQDNMAAMRALKTVLTTPSTTPGVSLEVSSTTGKKQFATGGKALSVFQFSDPAAVSVSVRSGVSKDQPIHLLMYTDYQPLVRGSLVTAENAGFAVDRELIAIGSDGSPADKYPVAATSAVTLPQDTVVEEHVTVVNFANANFVAVSVPIAAGFEPLNPNLAGAPKEAAPLGSFTARPTYSLYADDGVVFYYNELPKGTYHFYFRVRASFTGSFSEPPAKAELMYNLAQRGRSNGTEIRITTGDSK